MIECYVKYIVCEVEPAHRAEFSAAQHGWVRTAEAPGFLGQLGGWAHDAGQAVIVALWRDRAAYEGFWNTLHHEILAGSNQALHYLCVTSSFVRARLDLASPAELDAALVRVARLAVRTARDEPFAPPAGGFRLTSLAAEKPLAIAFAPSELTAERSLPVAVEPGWTVSARAVSVP